MTDSVFEIDNGVLIKYNGGSVAEIPDGVTEIGEYSFLGCEDVEKVIVPESVKRIGQQAFRGCSLLREINLPDGLERIARFSFCECGSLEEISIPESVSEIGNSAFRCCDMLISAKLPETIERIGESAFSDCTSLRSINIPKGISVIRKRSFSSCRSLTVIDIPEGVTEIAEHAFDNCASLSRCNLPETLERIGNHTFSGCSELADISVPGSVTHIGSSAFNATPLINAPDNEFVIVGKGILISCRSDKEINEVPSGVISIGQNSFTNNTDLKKVILPESVKQICDYAFEYCVSLESIKLPDKLERIGSRAFIDCAALSDIDLPGEIKDIGSDAFFGTAKLESLTDDIVVFSDKYLIRARVSDKTFSIPSGIELIAGNAFSGSSGIEEMIIPDSVKYIGAGAFKSLPELKKIVIPETVVTLGDEALISSGGLSAVIHPVNLTLGENVFSHSSKLTLENSGRSFAVILSDDSGASSPVIRFGASPSKETFEAMTEQCDLVPSAACYADMIPECDEYLTDHVEESICYAVSIEDNVLLEKLLSSDHADEAQIQHCIEYAISALKHEQQIILMRYKNDRFGDHSVDEIISDKFTL